MKAVSEMNTVELLDLLFHRGMGVGLGRGQLYLLPLAPDPASAAEIAALVGELAQRRDEAAAIIAAQPEGRAGPML